MLTGLQKCRLKGFILPKALGGHQKKPQNLEYTAPYYRILCKPFLLHTATSPIWPFPRNKASCNASHWVWLLLPLGCMTPTSLSHQIISSHIYGCTTTDTPELLQIPCCEASSKASSVTYSAMKVKLKSWSPMYSAFCVSYFYVNLAYL